MNARSDAGSNIVWRFVKRLSWPGKILVAVITAIIVEALRRLGLFDNFQENIRQATDFIATVVSHPAFSHSLVFVVGGAVGWGGNIFSKQRKKKLLNKASYVGQRAVIMSNRIKGHLQRNPIHITTERPFELNAELASIIEHIRDLGIEIPEFGEANSPLERLRSLSSKMRFLHWVGTYLSERQMHAAKDWVRNEFPKIQR